MSDKAVIIINTALISIALLLAYKVYDLKDSLYNCQKEKQGLENILASKDLEIDTYKNQKPKIVDRIVTKYENIPSVDSTCDAKLSSIQSMLSKFYD